MGSGRHIPGALQASSVQHGYFKNLRSPCKIDSNDNRAFPFKWCLASLSGRFALTWSEKFLEYYPYIVVVQKWKPIGRISGWISIRYPIGRISWWMSIMELMYFSSQRSIVPQTKFKHLGSECQHWAVYGSFSDPSRPTKLNFSQFTNRVVDFIVAFV